ncbi:conjugal transfer protein TrbL [Trinickia symbiotica]|uniref:Conjugal transfer protein TrbL n=1 Tax=Trinickia symbiotica TaxID=863227 RepID=A0A2T3XMQ1_9BURK|nr:type IV secretion system protein [Trinickia symbiotica]PTB17783.1 conjugal transfer protein TrbL [Trinickia symbiotica]
MNDVLSVINTLFALMQSQGRRLETVFLIDGIDLLGALGLIMATWHVLMWALDGDFPSFFANLFRHLVKCAILFVMLMSWTSTVHGYFVDNMQAMANRVSGGQSDPTGLVRVLMSAGAAIIEDARSQATQVCEQVPDTTPDGVVIPGASHVECGSNFAETGQGPTAALGSIWTLVKNLPLILLTFLAKGLALVAILLMTLVFVVVVQFGSFLLSIALCLGPVLIPWYVLPATDFLFDGWLKFTIAAGLYKVIAWIMMTIVATGALPAIRSISEQAASQASSNPDAYYAANYLAMCAIALVAGIGAYMMWQVPDIARGIVTGSGGGGLGGFGRGLIAKRFISYGKR